MDNSKIDEKKIVSNSSRRIKICFFACFMYLILSKKYWDLTSNIKYTGFGGLEVTCWPLVLKFAGSHPAEAVGFLGRKNPQHAFLRRGSKAVGPMS